MKNISSSGDYIAAIKANQSLSDIVSQHVALKQCSRELKGCCPFHEDRTPSFFVNDEKGQYHCFGCGAAGDVINFVQEFYGVDCKEACEILDGETVVAGYLPRPKSKDTSGKVKAAQAIWAKCTPIHDTPAVLYLQKRALPVEFAGQQHDLRFSELQFDGSDRFCPALIAAVRNLDGEVVAIQRIFLTQAGDKAASDCKRTLGTIKGHAVRFAGENAPCGDFTSIYLCEGIEDALSIARIIDNAHVWATVGTSNLANVILPANCIEVTIAHDNDVTGLQAAEAISSSKA